MARSPVGPPPPPVVQRVRIRYAKRGRLRFASHRDFARAFERALRRARVPIAYSAGFSPHPKVSYVGAAPTGTASEAEYLEIGLAETVDVGALRTALDGALPDGLDLLDAVDATASGKGFADRMAASRWQLRLDGASEDEVRAAVAALLAAESAVVERLTRDGRREVDVRGAIVSAVSGAETEPAGGSFEAPGVPRVILNLVVRHGTPAVRPDDVLAALRDVGGLAQTGAALAVRLAQGPLDDAGRVGDPLAPDRVSH